MLRFLWCGVRALDDESLECSIEQLRIMNISSQASLAHCSICCLPFPPNISASLYKERPYSLEHIQADPPLKGPMDRGIVRKFAWKVIPLTACSQSKTNGIEDGTRVASLPSLTFRRVQLCKHSDDLVPEGVR